jgi:hypothetical protein
MLAIVLALAAAISFSASDYAAGLATRRASVVRVTFVTELTHTALLMCLIPLVSSQAPSLTHWPGGPWPGSAAWPGRWPCTWDSGTPRSASPARSARWAQPRSPS